jgi:hypothetical protein
MPPATGWRRRTMLIASLWAIRYSHGLIGRFCSRRGSARSAFSRALCVASWASSVLSRIERQ